MDRSTYFTLNAKAANPIATRSVANIDWRLDAGAPAVLATAAGAKGRGGLLAASAARSAKVFLIS